MKISEKIIKRLRQDAERLGLSVTTTRRNFEKARDIGVAEYERLNEKAVNRKSHFVKPNRSPVIVLRNEILQAMLDIDKYSSCYAGVTSYAITIGDDAMKIKNGKQGEVLKNLSFKEVLLLSAIYSQLMNTDEKPDLDGRYPVTLRSIYESLHGSKYKWSDTETDKRKKLFEEIMDLSIHLLHVHGEYTWCWHKASGGKIQKNFEKAVVGEGFFLSDDLFESKDAVKFVNTQYKGAVLRFRKPPFLEIVKKQRCITTIPDGMLEYPKKSVDDDTLKYYLAFRVVQSLHGMQKTVLYKRVKELFGEKHQKIVKGYMKWLEDKGYIEGLSCDKDAVRWERTKRTASEPCSTIDHADMPEQGESGSESNCESDRRQS